jgi:hypothetical protein
MKFDSVLIGRSRINRAEIVNQSACFYKPANLIGLKLVLDFLAALCDEVSHCFPEGRYTGPGFLEGRPN